MVELEKNEEINRLIAVTKSDSGISGPELAKSHMRLGELLAKRYFTKLDPADTTAVSYTHLTLPTKF